MGNYRFRFSDMIPNAWFYKLKDMSKTSKQYNSHHMKKKPPSISTTSQKSNISQPRYSYYTPELTKDDKFYNSPIHTKASDTHCRDSPRKSSKKRTKRKTIYKPSPRPVSSSVSAGCSCHATLNTVWTKSSPSQSPDYSLSPLESSPEPYFHESLPSESDNDDFAAPDSFDHQLASWSSSCNCKVSSSTTDIIIDMNNESFTRKFEKLDGFDAISELELPPILTKPAKFNDKTTEGNNFKRRSSKLEEIQAHKSLSLKVVKEESIRTQKEQRINPLIRKSSSNSTGIRLRSNSPRIASKKIQAYARKSVSSNTCLKSKNKSLSESFAVVKSSVDPQRDFRDSMVEMIVENNIRASKDLEELLACYLQLNSNEYHDLIIKAFEQIWFDITDQRM